MRTLQNIVETLIQLLDDAPEGTLTEEDLLLLEELKTDYYIYFC